MTSPWRVALCAASLLGGAGCAVQQNNSNWAIDQQVVYCSNTRAAGFVVGDTRTFSGVPILGPTVRASEERLKEEQACQIVRGLGAAQITAIKQAQLNAARGNQTVTSEAFIVTAHPVGADCVPVTTVHRLSGIALRQESLCKLRQGDYAPYGPR